MFEIFINRMLYFYSIRRHKFPGVTVLSPVQFTALNAVEIKINELYGS